MESMLAFKLQSLGLVQLEDNAAKPRCLLYSRYFSQKLRGRET
ncbi:MAG: AAA-like domain-containing protein [Halothece sp.]